MNDLSFGSAAEPDCQLSAHGEQAGQTLPTQVFPGAADGGTTQNGAGAAQTRATYIKKRNPVSPRGISISRKANSADSESGNAHPKDTSIPRGICLDAKPVGAHSNGISAPHGTNPGGRDSGTLRLQRYLALSGVASRRKCEEFITAGRVSVNGSAATELGTKVSADDAVLFDGNRVQPETTKRYVLFNKPVGYVCSCADEQNRPLAGDIVASRYAERLYNIGRLDMYSSGLLIFTNDGDFAARVSHPSSNIEKEYVADTAAPIPGALVEQFARGIRIDGVFYRCSAIRQLAPRRVRIALVEGKNREIRRVFAHFEVPIKRLARIRIGILEIGSLREGGTRNLTSSEVSWLRNPSRYNSPSSIDTRPSAPFSPRPAKNRLAHANRRPPDTHFS
ncbi:pseudouridine synthase [Treponema endosymbiont of Eucomonympha sp.]|uniref:pseudouridine synthase n=1 Tax=Treponema endosymbiont of Eucomonympha sp. TaxID=1580831 RepID=UPI000A83DAF5|nr:pseudouridine synthase [Treponema endosymbiont of Eucomonympha sp.]